MKKCQHMIVISLLSLSLLLGSFFSSFAVPSSIPTGTMPTWMPVAIATIRAEGLDVIAFRDSIGYHVHGYKLGDYYNNDYVQYLHLKQNGTNDWYLSNSEDAISFYVLSQANSTSTTTPPASPSYGDTTYATGSIVGFTNTDAPKDNFTVYYSNRPIYGSDYVNTENKGTSLYAASADSYITKTLYWGQQINFSYSLANKSSFLLTLDSSNDAVLQVGYTLNGAMEQSKGQILVDSYSNRIDKADLSTFETLVANELMFMRPNTLFDSGSSTQTITVSFDSSKCNYFVSNVNTGTIVDGGNTTTPVTPGTVDIQGIPGVDVFPDDDAIQRANYPEGLEGTIMFYMDNLFTFLSAPFRLLAQFFTMLGGLITQAVGSISGLTGAMQSVYGVLPATLSFLITFAVAITVFKMIFGR